jgi:ATP adenylyltransferase
LVVAPREHITAVSDLAEQAAVELGPLLRRTTQVIEALTAPEQIYVCMWSHGQAQRKHLHFVVQPVTIALMDKYGGRRSEQLQAAMFNSGEDPDLAEVERFCRQARDLFVGWPDGAP